MVYTNHSFHKRQISSSKLFLGQINEQMFMLESAWTVCRPWNESSSQPHLVYKRVKSLALCAYIDHSFSLDSHNTTQPMILVILNGL